MSEKKKTLREAYYKSSEALMKLWQYKTVRRIYAIVMSVCLIIIIGCSVSMCSGGGSDYESSEPGVEQVLSNDELKGIDDALGGTLSDKYGKLSD